MSQKKECTDHTGTVFPSTVAKCQAWGLTPQCYNRRLSIGWSEEEALTGRRNDATVYEDPIFHNIYLYKKDMYEAFNTNKVTVERRLSKGWTLAEALTGKKGFDPATMSFELPKHGENSQY